MKIEITNEYAPYSKYISALGKESLADIKNRWGDWAKISFQTQKNEETELDQTLITIEFDDMSKLGTMEKHIDRFKVRYVPTKMWKKLINYAVRTLSMVKFSNGDGCKATMAHPETVNPNVPTIVLSWRCEGEHKYTFIHNPPFKIRLLDSHNQVWSQVGYEDEWFKPLQKEHLLTERKYPKKEPMQYNA